MFQLIKGNSRNLEGMVIIYSHYKLREPRNNSHTGMYVFTNSLDFIEKVGYADGLKRIPVDELEEMMIFFYCHASPPIPTLELVLGQEDVVHAGKFATERCGVRAVHSAFCTYLGRFRDQWLIKNSTKYKNLDPKTFKNQVDNFCTDMLDSRLHDNRKTFLTCKKYFLKFTAGAPFMRDVIDLCELFRGKTLDFTLVHHYKQKICAVHSERYEQAARAEERINKMKAEISSTVDLSRAQSSVKFID